MQLRMQNVPLSLLLGGSLILVSAQVQALASDNQQPIHIYSTQQSVDMTTNTVTLTGYVVVKRGSINIRANRMVISRSTGKNGNEIIEGYGNPVTFYHLQDDGKPVRGHAQKVRYEGANDVVILMGNAYLDQLDSNVAGDCITYLLKKQKMEAFSDKGKRVNTVLVPAQLRDKNRAKAPVK
ncbi:lipopolysaccharide ABC transporter substrate-binding protein LptA [secondary endosymbiont of Ctenarytaina eucalypti]|uniref:Lipopolysaccharide export system protein LptA n=1 Tax=secondary endosymbiont of Ctenarytaina eucalypti TaxID=1199245 RepID=J3VTF6_9ENTR|nr:lipopolysaccharide ABC transporter substrate-binding protein LptA [secondary endosymbiont of Ctenarytaina eucalypti]AFP85256.1 lipopolysaccharide transport periplasmic protein LptA [secondary endosymbiont of Ctenarytaina eucalypti]